MVHVSCRHVHKGRKKRHYYYFTMKLISTYTDLWRLECWGLMYEERGRDRVRQPVAMEMQSVFPLTSLRRPAANPSTYRHLSQFEILFSIPWSNKPCSLLSRALLWFVCSAKVFLLLTFLPRDISMHPSMFLYAPCLPSSLSSCNLGNLWSWIHIIIPWCIV